MIALLCVFELVRNMTRPLLDFTACNYCSDDEKPLQNYYGTVLCQDCIDMEVNTDWDEWERKKRQSIAESNEY
jgi:hypothetical protein|tara:strand:- start:499 stop:717 length:219 start_codon:yes stop_codon:yes gene_type:complete